MKPLFEYKAAIFDLDGTLTDSMHAWDNICRNWLLAKGRQTPPGLETDIELMTLTQSAEYVREQFGITLPPERIIGEWRNMVLWRYEQEIELKPRAGELLRALAMRGVKLGLATSCFPEACEAVLCRHSLRPLFDTVVYSDEVAQDKSHPDIWLACAERLKVAPTDCVVFEDLFAAERGIRAAGMGFVAVYDKSCKSWPSLSQAADMAVEDLGELL